MLPSLNHYLLRSLEIPFLILNFVANYAAQRAHYNILLIYTSIPHINVRTPSVYILHTLERSLDRRLRDRDSCEWTVRNFGASAKDTLLIIYIDPRQSPSVTDPQ